MALYQAQLSGDGGAFSKGVNVLLPQMAKVADQSREKEMVQRIQDNIWVYCYDVQQRSWQDDYRK